MPNSWFQFKQFTVQQDKCAMKVTTDACLFGAWAAKKISTGESGAQQQETRVLDIGTGTGLLSLMLAQKCAAKIDAVEIDRDSFEQACDNISHSPWKENIRVWHADANDFIARASYDVIISNPPFYENELRSASDKKNIAHHSHALSLDQLLLLIRQHLSPQGRFYLLLPYKRKEEIKNLLNRHALFIHEMVEVSQSTRHTHFRLLIEGGLQKPDEVIETIITIQDHQRQYTPEFAALLKDYYLQG